MYSDFWILPETHCRENELLKLDSYQVYQVNRKVNNNNRRGSGGIAIAVNDSVLETHIIIGIHRGIEGQLGLKLKCKLNDFLIGLVGLYLPPDSYIYGQNAEHFFNEASVIWNDMSDCDILIGAGDLNARTKDMLDYLPEIDGNLPQRFNPDPTKNAHGNNFITFLKDNRAIILNGRITPEYNNFTFVSTRGSSVPDYMFCPLDQHQYCAEMKTLLVRDLVNSMSIPPPPSLPDHSILSAVFFSSNFDFGQNERSSFEPFNNHISANMQNKIPKKNLKKIEENFFMDENTRQQVSVTIAKLETIECNQGEVDRLWEEIKGIFLNEMESLPSIPVINDKKMKKSFRNSQPFWNNELKNLWFIACQAEKNYLNCKVSCQRDLPIKNNFKNVFKSAQTNFDKKFRYLKRKFNSQKQKELLDLASENNPNIWVKIKKLNSPPSRPPLEIVRADQTISTNIKEILERWHLDISRLFSGLRDNPEMAYDEDFYQEIISKKEEFEKMEEIEQQNFSNFNFSSEYLNSEISFNEVSKAIDKTKLGKAYLDIPNDVLKNQNAKTLLHKYFNLCFSSGINPTEWDYSNIKPIPKPDKDPRDPLQNRCITILCCVAKVYSSILNRRLQIYLESNDILVNEQNGFRASRSCIDHIFVLVTVIRNRKVLGKDTFLAFVDYKKAFDSVERNCLLFKLAKIGINGKMYQAIAALYSNPRSRVVLNDHETEYFECPIGVKQGDCLSPTLFAIFINDLASEIKDSNIGIDLNIEGGPDIGYIFNILLYADDIVCLAESEVDLQDILVIIENWCKKWRLEINLTKTNILHIRNKRKPQSQFTFLFDMRPVPYCKYYKYLGVTINEHLDFKFTMEKLSDSAGRALSAILTKMIKNGGFPYNVYSKLYNACVTSIVDYSGPLTGFDKYDSSMKLHLRAIRAFLGVPKNVCSVGLVSEVDLILPQYRTNILMVRQYHRMLCMNNSKLTKQIYLWDRALNESNIVKTWSNEVQDIFEQTNNLAVYSSNTIFDLKSTITNMISSFKIKQKEYLIQECGLMPKLRTFNLFKNFQEQPAYVTKPLTFHHRRMLAKTRLGCLPLRVETGRYTVPRLPEHHRTCLVCSVSDQLVNINTVELGPVESETHYLFQCEAYSAERAIWFGKMTLPDNFENLPTETKLKVVLNDQANIKFTAQFIVEAFNIRSKILK